MKRLDMYGKELADDDPDDLWFYVSESDARALAARLAEAERERDMWYARAISLFWNRDDSLCEAVRKDADAALEWIRSRQANKAARIVGEADSRDASL